MAVISDMELEGIEIPDNNKGIAKQLVLGKTSYAISNPKEAIEVQGMLSKDKLNKQIQAITSLVGKTPSVPKEIKNSLIKWVKSGKPIYQFSYKGKFFDWENILSGKIEPALQYELGFIKEPPVIKQTIIPNGGTTPKKGGTTPKYEDKEEELKNMNRNLGGKTKQALPEGLQAQLMPFKKLPYQTKFAPFNALFGGGAAKDAGDAANKSLAVMGGGIGMGLLDAANNAITNQYLITQANKYGGGKIVYDKGKGKYVVVKGKGDFSAAEQMASEKNAIEKEKMLNALNISSAKNATDLMLKQLQYDIAREKGKGSGKSSKPKEKTPLGTKLTGDILVDNAPK